MRTCLNAHETASLKKQRHTTKRIYDSLVNELGFIGGESTTRRLMQELRIKALERHSFRSYNKPVILGMDTAV